MNVLLDGRGFVRIATLDTDRYGDDDLTLLYWAIGLHLGEPWAQNKHGHVLGDVTDQGKTVDDPTVRGNELGGIALDYHTDGSDLVGLLCLRAARTGGLSCVANAVAIHNHLVRESPELAAALYDALPYDTRGEQAEGARAFYSVPGFTEHAGRLFVRFIPQYILASQRHPDAPRLSPTAREAIATVSALANDPDFNVYMDLQPGEMQFINNYHVLHGRTAYEDDVAHGYKRHLKRLWLATYALSDRPAHFAALGRRSHWEARRSVSRLPAVERACRASEPRPAGPGRPGVRPTRPLAAAPAQAEAPACAHEHRPLDEGRRQRTLAQDPDRRDGGVDQRRRRPLASPAVDHQRHLGGVEGLGHLRRLVKLSGTVRQGPCSRHSRRSARPSGMPTTTAQAPTARPSGRRPARIVPVVGALRAGASARGRNTSSGPGQQRSSSRPTSSVQPEVSGARASVEPTA